MRRFRIALGGTGVENVMGFLSNRKRATSSALQRALGAPVGIDFGTSSLKVLQLAGEGPYTLAAAGCVETPFELLSRPKERLEFQYAALPKLVGSLPLKGRRAVCAIPGPLTFCKHAQFPKQDAMPVEVLADNMLTEQIGRDASTLIRRLIEVPTTRAGAKSEYICVATGREVVDRLMKTLRASKLEIVGIHSEFEAALRAFGEVNRREADTQRATMYLELGAGATRCFIGHGADLVFARTIEIGGMHLDRALAHDRACSVDQAHLARLSLQEIAHKSAPFPARRATVGASGSADTGGVIVAEERRAHEGAPGEPVATSEAPSGTDTDPGAGHALQETLEILTDEASMGVRYHDAIFPEARVGEVLFMGGESRHRALCQHLARALRLPAKTTDPLSRLERNGSENVVGLDIQAPQPGWAVPVGLCQSPTDF